MKVFLTGGTGFVGRYFAARFTDLGHDVTILARTAQKAGGLPASVRMVEGDPKRPGQWQQEVAAHDLVINLAGSSIFTLWTDAAKRSIVDSRVQTTRNIVDALAGNGKGKLLVTASAVGYYGARLDDAVLDESSPPGNDFSAEVCEKWEDEAKRALDYGVRVVRGRFGIVLGRGGGALSKMTPAFRAFLGSPLGSGRQWFSWIHQEDLFRIMMFAAEHAGLSGAVNCTAPNPVRNRELAKILARSLNRLAFMPAVPAFIIRGLLREFGDVVLKGQRVMPKKLLDEGFHFCFPGLQDALRDLLGC